MLLTTESSPEPDSVIKAPRIQGLHKALLVSAGILHKQNKEPREAGIYLVYMGLGSILSSSPQKTNKEETEGLCGEVQPYGETARLRGFRLSGSP